MLYVCCRDGIKEGHAGPNKTRKIRKHHESHKNIPVISRRNVDGGTSAIVKVRRLNLSQRARIYVCIILFNFFLRHMLLTAVTFAHAHGKQRITTATFDPVGCLRVTGLFITHGGICTCLGVILICYTRYNSLCECIMSVIRWLVVQEVSSRSEFARHFESHFGPATPLLYAHANTTTSVEHSIVAMLHSTRIIFSTYSLSLVHNTSHSYAARRGACDDL